MIATSYVSRVGGPKAAWLGGGAGLHFLWAYDCDGFDGVAGVDGIGGNPQHRESRDRAWCVLYCLPTKLRQI